MKKGSKKSVTESVISNIVKIDEGKFQSNVDKVAQGTVEVIFPWNCGHSEKFG